MIDMLRGILLLAVSSIFILIFASYLTISMAQNNSHCTVPSSCGNINIKYPFGLKSVSKNYGHPHVKHTLECENNQTMYYAGAFKYRVLEINYNDYTARLSDPGLDSQNYSSCPIYSSREDYYNQTFGSVDLMDPKNHDIIFINCLSPVKNPLYVQNSFCKSKTKIFNSSGACSYVAVERFKFSDLKQHCTVDSMVLASAHGLKNKLTSSSIHNLLAYGFDVTWYQDSDVCEKCIARNGTCLPMKNGALCSCHECFFNISYCVPHILLYDVIPMICLGIGGITALKCLCGFPSLIGLVLYRWRKRHLAMDDGLEDFLQRQNKLMPIKYTYSDVKKMTKNFKEKLGEGGHGAVFKGKLRSGLLVAVKMMANSQAGDKEFANEVVTIGRIHHVNVVKLVGFCIEGSKRALVYEYSPNGSLDKYVFTKNGAIRLSYKQMFGISLQVARGIDYLHRGCHMKILHFDIKPHNILLGQNFNPKISDFGLAKFYSTDESTMIVSAARGTMGYMAPELFYGSIGRVSHKADVYSFGMLLMEMAGRRKTLNPFADSFSQIYFPSWIYDQLNEGKRFDITDATLEETIMTTKMILVAFWCIQINPDDRPSMNKIVEMLEGDLELLSMPPKPFLVPPQDK